MAEQQSNISINPAQAYLGLNLNSTIRQVKPGMLTYALNAALENWDGNSITYQNEQGTELCVQIPTGFRVIGQRNIIEKGITILWLANPTTGASEIGKIVDCVYSTIINAPCLNLSIYAPILKSAVKITNCTTEVYWTDGTDNGRRWIDLDHLPFKEIEGCPPVESGEIDCNKLQVQPNFSIPELIVEAVRSDGDLEAGTYQFAIQYANAKGEEYTSYYSVTNPVPIFDPTKITQDFNFHVGKSIVLAIRNLDTTGFFDFFNLAVIKTVNNITSVQLIGTFDITGETKTITYTGQGKTDIRLTVDDIFEKFPSYDIAQDVTSVQDVLVWGNVTTSERISYQKIANQISIEWQTWKMPGDKVYANELNATYLRGYMRDEVYPLEIVLLLTKGRQTDGFHIPGRVSVPTDLEMVSNNDVIDPTADRCGDTPQPRPRWQVYNTGCNLGKEQVYTDFINGITYPCVKCPPVISTNTAHDDCYIGPYEHGCMSYWESTDVYPCDTEVWGDLANTPIRHHKFPDSLITHIHDSVDNIYPIGIKIDVGQILNLINNSTLSAQQKSEIVGFKIVRGNRVNNKSVIAKGLINNIGLYAKDKTTYFFPNYPYNDLRQDPYLVGGNNYSVTNGDGVHDQCLTYKVINTSLISNVTVSYVGCPPNSIQQSFNVGPNTTSAEFCSLTYPTVNLPANGVIVSGSVCGTEGSSGGSSLIKLPLDAFSNLASLQRWAFHSPDTHFYQPNLGNVIKLETAEYGKTLSHFVQVKKHSRYHFITNVAIITALGVGIGVGFASATIGVSTQAFDGTAAYTAFQVFLDIINRTVPRKNFVYQHNSIANYTNFTPIPNNGAKQRFLDIAAYASPGMINIGDIHTLNNWERESSVYLRATKPLPFPSTIPGVPEDNSRYTLSESGDCNNPGDIENRDVSSYYASIKNEFANQYGQIYSYETIDTGYQFIGNISNPSAEPQYASVFGGDIFINKFAYKTKLPLFLDNRVGFPDEADVEYNELGNVAWPKWWFSTDIRQGAAFGLFGIKNTNFDCRNDTFFYENGKIYLFVYGIPYFYCESEVNVDLRQAYNASEGDFFPRVSSGIPDDWLQEINTTIQQDNTYWYNKSFSKQNKENFFSHLPADFEQLECRKILGMRAIYSEKQTDWIEGTSNRWLVYRPVALFDFPDIIVSLDGIENKAILARFQNKSKLYNAMLTIDTSNPKAAYLGNSSLFAGAPPIDFAETDLGYAGSQHKFLLKTEYGHIYADAKRGQVFIITGTTAKELTNENVRQWFTEFLSFEIQKAFPTINIDNHFNTVGLHGVYDNKYNRFILTKIDYKPIVTGITYVNNKFYLGSTEISLKDTRYFCNYSFTISYNFDIQNWVSFHSYIPNFYIGDSNLFYSGVNDDGTERGVWKHNTSIFNYNNYYGVTHPYILEYPYSYQYNDEILQNVRDYTKVLQYLDWDSYIELDDTWFNKCILYNNQQCSGVLEMVEKPKNNLAVYSSYPIYNADSKTITFVKRDNFYQINTFWALNVDKKKPIWNRACADSLSIFKELNQANMSYTKRSFHKDTLRAKDLKCRMIMDNHSDVKMISQFIVAPTQKSYL